MNLKQYYAARERFHESQPQYRRLCLNCRQPDFRCYCAHLKPFDPEIKFVILIHPLEMKRQIATGRMTHLSLKNSELILGYDYSQNERVTEIVNDPAYHSVVLYPGPSSVNMTSLLPAEREDIFPKQKKLVIFVIDGTWNTARKTIRLSENLKNLPQIFFSPERPSRFRVRTQPKPECYSTIEAVHHTIELLGSSRGFNTHSREHDSLLHLFDRMVEQQAAYVKKNHSRHQRK